VLLKESLGTGGLFSSLISTDFVFVFFIVRHVTTKQFWEKVAIGFFGNALLPLVRFQIYLGKLVVSEFGVRI
jgi:hypothetical protein